MERTITTLEHRLRDFQQQTELMIENTLGYPSNRQYAFNINPELFGFKNGTLATTHLNNIASPFSTINITNSKEFEIELINKLSIFFNFNDAFGYVTGGGTEGNFAAIWWHRNYLRKTYNVNPVLVCSDASHYSLFKIADQLNIEITIVKSHKGVIDLDFFESAILKLKKPIIMVCTVGSSIYGGIDNIIEIKKLLDTYKNNQFKLHADGAIYGVVVPYLHPFKTLNSIFDLIDSLSFSGHKFLGALSVSGCVLTAKKYIDSLFNNNEISYIHNALDVTVTGSRSGLAVIELFSLLDKALQKTIEGNTLLYNTWHDCVRLTEWFYQQVLAIVEDENLVNYNKGQLAIVIPKPRNNQKMLYQKYGLMPVGECFGIYVFPRITQNKLQLFLDEYKESW